MAGTFTDGPTKNANPIVESEHRERSVRFTESHSDELLGSYDCTSPFSTVFSLHLELMVWAWKWA
jgi:hypothetical protein